MGHEIYLVVRASSFKKWNKIEKKISKYIGHAKGKNCFINFWFKSVRMCMCVCVYVYPGTHFLKCGTHFLYCVIFREVWMPLSYLTWKGTSIHIQSMGLLKTMSWLCYCLFNLAFEALRHLPLHIFSALFYTSFTQPWTTIFLHFQDVLWLSLGSDCLCHW